MNNYNGLNGRNSDEFQDPKIVDLVGRILASAARRHQEDGHSCMEKPHGKKPGALKLDIRWKK
jgi:hypothetical protein